MVKYIPNYYAILKIDEDADKNTIREAYEKLSDYKVGDEVKLAIIKGNE